MKAICIGRNYSDHIRELNNAVPEQPIIFIKTEDNFHFSYDFNIPDFTSDLHYECELVLKIDKDISQDFKGRWTDVVSEVTLGIDLTARDVQERLKSKSLPWELAKNFRQSAIFGEFIPLDKALGDEGEILYDFYVNEQVVQHGDTRYMIFDVDSIIQFVLKYFDVRRGDVIFTGTPAGVGRVHSSDVYSGVLNGHNVLNARAV